MAEDHIQQAALAIIGKSREVLVGSVDDQGWPTIKAMLEPREHNGLKEFYSSTNTSSMRVRQFIHNPKACLYFYDRMQFKGVMLRGFMEVLQDQATKNRIWREGDTVYYPLGTMDPDYCVLRFTAVQGRYYENLSSTDFAIR